MSKRFRFFLSFVLATSGMLTLQSAAWASYVANSLNISVTGDATASASDTTNSGAASIVTTNNNVKINTSADTNSTNTLSDLFNSTLKIQNLDSSLAKTVTVSISAQFDSPQGLSTLLSSLTINTSTSGVWTATKIMSSVGAVSAVNNDHSSADSLPLTDVATNHVNISGIYTLTGTVTLALQAGAYVNFTLDSQVVAPAPNSAVLALAGVPMLGLFGWLRRRNSVAPELSMA